MRSLAKPFVCLLIVIALFLFEYFSVSSVIEDSNYQEEFGVLHSRIEFQFPEQTVEPSPRPTMELSPVESPEPILEGKDLYIFYINEIIKEWYPSVDPYIVLAVMEIESDFQPNTGREPGPVGLMQVIPKYHLWRIQKYGFDDIRDPYANIMCGIDFLNELYMKHGTWSKALYGYNASTAYVNKVLKKADILRKDGYFG